MLAELGITQEEYDAMSPEEKNKVNKKIEELEKIEAQHKIAEAESPQPMMKASAGEAIKEHDSHQREFDIRSPDTDEPDSPTIDRYKRLRHSGEAMPELMNLMQAQLETCHVIQYRSQRA
uniref:Uncharacterized protein n=1 Tax=Tanacetum cinerariifolium TaxID=118510 RepID=A0A699R164_TANCI|nr:hypothetical protein [Tanacetum cinerariifolium]